MPDWACVEDLLKEFQWNHSIIDDILRVMALGESKTGQRRFEQITGGPGGVEQLRLVGKDEAGLAAQERITTTEERVTIQRGTITKNREAEELGLGRSDERKIEDECGKTRLLFLQIK